MPEIKPKIFIASSTENLNIAYAIQNNLDQEADVTVWSQAALTLSGNILDDLIKISSGMDFGVFILSPEDVIKIRNQEFWAARDNVIFELGLFIGKIGKERNFLIVPRGQQDFRLPSDLAGINFVDFERRRTDGNLRAALGASCSKIRDTIQRHGRIHNPCDDIKITLLRLVEVLQVDFSEVKRKNWQLIYSINENGNGYLHEEVTLFPSTRPLYFCLANEVYKKNLAQELRIEVLAKSLTYGTSLQVIERERTTQSAKYAILLDPPSLPETPQRIAIDYECSGIWNDLIERGEDQGVFSANYQSDYIQIEFLAPPGRKWKWFTPSPQIGDIRMESSMNPSRIIWSITNPPTRRYSYRLALEK
jgi:hypothetical protein